MFISKLSTELKRGTPLILSWKVRSVFTFGNNRECHNYASWKRMRVSKVLTTSTPSAPPAFWLDEEDQQQVVGLNIKDGRGGIRGELDTNAALLLQPQIATNNQCRACRVWYDEGWRVNVAFPAFHQREPITVEQVHEPIFGDTPATSVS